MFGGLYLPPKASATSNEAQRSRTSAESGKDMVDCHAGCAHADCGEEPEPVRIVALGCLVGTDIPGHSSETGQDEREGASQEDESAVDQLPLVALAKDTSSLG